MRDDKHYWLNAGLRRKLGLDVDINIFDLFLPKIVLGLSCGCRFCNIVVNLPQFYRNLTTHCGKFGAKNFVTNFQTTKIHPPYCNGYKRGVEIVIIIFLGIQLFILLPTSDWSKFYNK